ncbi:hypothetical protein IGB42_01542 [Andreprevotia sp. IGB-42]|uniref:VOC family protein n=1 Tax=Andreprevotia sp. IGB-42 TaxID=2497473 RepID=UPI00157E6C8F|nr:VOC family protein [Andreprevotia sp. IGB-42]KAF0813863.1 hypothetical protein IGB42_01542 [Andreprevotia sp. IGB-42]
MTDMQSEDPIFHLSIPVRDLAEARAFYCDELGARIGRVRDAWCDVWLFGAQITLQHQPAQVLPVAEQSSRHFGATLGWAHWQALAGRLAGTPYVLKAPQVLNAGQPDETAKLYLADPSGNMIELKAYRDRAQALAQPAQG